MQTLEVISVNIWLILISLLNLLILFLIFKKFLFKPVNNMLDKRQKEIDDKYRLADDANNAAMENKRLWDKKISALEEETNAMIKDAKKTAKLQRDSILAKAQEKADGIIRSAESQAELEKKKASDDVKREIVEVSSAIANKLLEREINVDDHHRLIDSYIEKIGE